MKRIYLLSVSILVVCLCLGISVEAFGQKTGLTSSGLEDLYLVRDYESSRVSSFDKTGANDDGNWKNKIQSGETRVIAKMEGPGIIKHIWITIATQESYHLKKIVLRIYWDDEKTASVEAPIGDFFGLTLGKYILYESQPLSIGSQRALNCYFPMPFFESATITVTNEGEVPINAFYYNIDYEKHKKLPKDLMYFHAQYRQETPTEGWTADWNRNGDEQINTKENLAGEGNYVLLEAEGRGHYVGVTHGIIQNQGDWWGEGDEMIFIDGAESAQIKGTGAEDYYLGAWCYGGCGINPFGAQKPTFAYDWYGNPLNGGDDRGAEWMVYRYHIESPIVFHSSIRVTIEHGHANHRSDNYYTVAYWYQTEPHGAFPELPSVEQRVPAQINTKGPTMGK